MKTKTKVNDIELMLALHEQHRILDVHKNKVKAELDSVLNSTDKTCTTLNTLVNNYLVSKKTVDQMKLRYWKGRKYGNGTHVSLVCYTCK